MYGNLFDTKNALRIRIARWSLVSLLRSGAAVFPNTKRTRAIFAEQVVERGLQARIVTHYDPVYVSKTPVQIGQKPSDGPLLVPGLDDHRRSPLAHLEKAHVDPPPRSLYIHAPGRSDKSVSEIRLKASSIVEDVVVSSTYRNQEELCELFASASWCLVAYRPSLSQGSGLLVQSIVSGTPVLCSRFPHADELFQEFGRLGEVFEFDDMNAFRTAWLRLQAWGSREWAEFREARAKLKEQVSPGRIAGSVIQLLETAPLSELIIESHPSNES